MIKRSLFSAVAVASVLYSQGQLVVDNTMDPQQLVQNVLLGGGVTVSNVTFNGVPVATPQEGLGSFTYAGAELDLANGLLLATGFLSSVPDLASTDMGDGLFYAGDPDLEVLTGGQPTFDAIVLEFDFVPNGNELNFRYVFASDEYPDYVCSAFNDAFGFFVSGPGIAGPFSGGAENIALIPGSSIPIAINTVNNGIVGFNGDATYCDAADPNWLSNTIYFNDNTFGTDIVWNGFTVAMEATLDVVCGETYHIKLAVADAGDDWLDSGVFLEAGSFSSNGQLLPELSAGSGVVDDTMMEGCGQVELVFTRTGDTNIAASWDITIGGTATAGTDYTPALPTTIAFAPGEITQSFFFDVPSDPDALETLIVTVDGMICAGQASEFTFYIDSPPALDVFMDGGVINCGDEIELFPDVTGGLTPYTYAWSTGEDTPTISVMPDTDTTYDLTVTDACGITFDVSATVSINAVPVGITVPGPIVVPCGQQTDIDISTAGGGGVLSYEWTADGVFVADTEDITVSGGAPTYYVVTVSDACGSMAMDSVLVSAETPAPIDVTMGPDALLPCLGQTTISVSTVTGGNGVYDYEWTFGGVVVGSGLASITVDELGTYEVTVTDGCGATAQGTVEVEPEAPEPIDITVSPETFLPCVGQVSISVLTAQGGAGTYDYQWYFGTDALGTTASINIGETGTYTVEVTDVCGGFTTADVLVSPQVYDPLVVTASPDLQLACLEQSQISVITTEGGQTPYVYAWTVDGVPYQNGTTANVTIGAAAYYVVTATDACGSTAQDSVLVEPIPTGPIVLDVSPDTEVICPGLTALLQVFDVQNATDPVELIWETTGGQFIGTGTSVEPVVFVTTTYVVTATDACDNTGVDSVLVTMPSVDPLQVTLPPDMTICIGDSVDLVAVITGGSGYYYVQWANSDLTDPVMSLTPTQTATYSITVTDQCGQIRTDHVLVRVEDIQVNIEIESVGQDDWRLRGITQPQAISWAWNMGDSTQYRGEQIFHSYVDLEEHWVHLEVISPNGCFAYDSVLIQPPAHLYFPNCFTPDGDGINDVFAGLGHSITDFELLIFNRWGELIFSTDELAVAWDGTVDGQQAQTGVYVYKYKARGHLFPDDEGVGHVTLLRGDLD